MWRVKDWFINISLDIRLWFLITFKPSRFNILNEKEKKGWELSFNDEFDADELDADKWLTHSYDGMRFHPGNITGHNKAPDEYLAHDYNTIEDGILKQKSYK